MNRLGFWWMRKSHKLWIWWRLDVPQFFCERLVGHEWTKFADWSNYGRICTLCLKKVIDGSSRFRP